MQPSMEEIATECESLLASNRLPTARWGKHPTLAYTSFRKPEEYPEGEASRQALNSAGTNTTSIFFIICIFSFTQLFNLFYSIFSLFFITNLIFYSSLFLLHFAFFLLFLIFVVNIIFSLSSPCFYSFIISPPSSQNHLYFLQSSHIHFFFLIIFLFSFHL